MKKYIYKIVNTLVIGVALFSVQACGFIDISKELSDNLNLEEVFNNPNYTKRWYNQMYQMIPLYSEMGMGANNFRTGIWNVIAGEVTSSQPPGLNYMVSGFNSSSSRFHKWANAYETIRQGLIFLDRAKDQMGLDTDKEFISASEMNRMKAETKFLIAYSYFQLFELYGPVPIVEDVQDPNDKDFDFPRATVDETINYIDKLLVEALESDDLPETINTKVVGNDYDHNNDRFNLNEMNRPTKVATLALRARLWVYAASPLFNGGYPEALTVANHDGTLLFPVADSNKWLKAKERLEDLFRFCDANGFALYYGKPDHDGNVNPHESIYELFQYYNNEILWATGNNNYRHVSLDMEPRSTPRDIYNAFGNVGVFQNGVDLFFMENGLPIDHPQSGYDEDGFSDYINVVNENKKVDKNIYNMYTNREPRFYNTVLYEGRSWHKNIPNKANYTTHFSKGGGADNGKSENPRTGYMLYKFKNRNILNTGTNDKSWARPWILFRLADFYLYYAEVCNEIDPSNPDIIKYLDKVRDRAGIPGYAELSSKGLLNIIGNQELQREAIQMERRVELYAEGNRYFDIRRWMTADKADGPDQQVVMSGMDMTQTAYEFNSSGIPIRYFNEIGTGSYYNRIEIENRAWRRQMLLYPIPYNEQQKSPELVQNPGWN